jgi:hypothetical protein
MILFITPQSRGPELAPLVQPNLSQETQCAQTVQEAATRLRERPYPAAIIDQFLLETEPDESDQTIEHLGTAYPVYINFAVTGLDRLVREGTLGARSFSPTVIGLARSPIFGTSFWLTST